MCITSNIAYVYVFNSHIKYTLYVHLYNIIYIHVYIHIYIHIYTYIHIHIYTIYMTLLFIVCTNISIEFPCTQKSASNYMQ
jgi:hypothetical protein